MTSNSMPRIAVLLMAAAMTVTCREELRPAGRRPRRAPAADLPTPAEFGLFGFNNPVETEHVGQLGEYLKDLHVSFVTRMFGRRSLEAKRGVLDGRKWRYNDEYVRQVVEVAGATLIGKIKPDTDWETTGVRLKGRKGKVTYAPGDWEAYEAYLRTLVSRYRGKIRYWTLGNEPHEYFKCPEVFAKFVRVSYRTIKATDPSARCILGAPAGNNVNKKYNRFYGAMLPDLGRDLARDRRRI